MAGCEKCWSEAGRLAFSRQSDKVEEYNKLLDERKDRPCYLDCPQQHPDHYSFTGCPACGFQWGVTDQEESE